jgi:hypothetical protein
VSSFTVAKQSCCRDRYPDISCLVRSIESLTGGLFCVSIGLRKVQLTSAHLMLLLMVHHKSWNFITDVGTAHLRWWRLWCPHMRRWQEVCWLRMALEVHNLEGYCCTLRGRVQWWVWSVGLTRGLLLYFSGTFEGAVSVPLILTIPLHIAIHSSDISNKGHTKAKFLQDVIGEGVPHSHKQRLDRGIWLQEADSSGWCSLWNLWWDAVWCEYICWLHRNFDRLW